MGHSAKTTDKTDEVDKESISKAYTFWSDLRKHPLKQSKFWAIKNATVTNVRGMLGEDIGTRKFEDGNKQSGKGKYVRAKS